MNPEPHPKEVVRWRWVLPVLAVVLTALLQAQGWYEWRSTNRYGATGFTTVQNSISMILSAPAFFFDRLVWLPFHSFEVAETYVEPSLLLNIAVLWTWIGWLIDKRHQQASFSRSYKVGWTCIYLMLICFCALWTWETTHELRWFGLPAFLRFIAEAGLRAHSIAFILASVWFVIGAAYFGARIVKLWRSRGTSSNLPIRKFDFVVPVFLVIGGLLGWAIVRFDYSRVYPYTNEQTVGTVRGCIAGAIIGWTWKAMRRRKRSLETRLQHLSRADSI